MVKIAIKGHPTRGKEVIQILESLGGINTCNYSGNNFGAYYELHGNSIVCMSTKSDNIKYYTLEEFEKEFPFKIGDKAKHITSICIIRKYCYINNKPCYEVESMELGIIATIPVKLLEPYNEMKEERNITLTLDKAKEWYKKGGEIKEVALQAYSEEELTKVKLPETWEEFCRNYPLKKGECWLGNRETINIISHDNGKREFKNWIPSKESAEAHLALIQLEQLRDCWRQGWVPDYTKTYKKYRIKKLGTEYIVDWSTGLSDFLVFQTEELAKEFLNCFKDLIKQAGDLI